MSKEHIKTYAVILFVIFVSSAMLIFGIRTQGSGHSQDPDHPREVRAAQEQSQSPATVGAVATHPIPEMPKLRLERSLIKIENLSLKIAELDRLRREENAEALKAFNDVFAEAKLKKEEWDIDPQTFVFVKKRK